MRKFRLVLTVCVFLFLFTTAVAAQDAPTPYPVPDTATVTIQAAIFGNSIDAFNAVMPAWYEAHPEIGVEFDVQTFDDHHARLLSAIIAGEGVPDVAMIEIAKIFQFADLGAMVNLLDEPYNAGQYQDSFVPYKWAQATSVDGRLVALPWDVGPQVIFYRRDLFEAAGLPTEPEEVSELLSTFDGMYEAASAITDPDAGTYFMNNASDIFMMYFRNNNLFDADLNPIVNAPETVEAMAALQRLTADGLVAGVDMWSSDWFTMVTEGHQAVQPVGAWFGSALRFGFAPEDVGLWGVARMPWQQGNWGGSFLGIPEAADQKAEAWMFIEWALTTPEIQNQMFATVDFMPALTTAWEDPFYDEVDPYYNQPVRQLWREIVNEVGEVTATPLDESAYAILQTHVVTCFNEGIPAQECLDAANEDIAAQLAPDIDELRAARSS